MRHLYQSKQLTTILSKLGHCETYDFGLEIETALDEVSTTLPPQIVTGEGNKVFHLEWDNLNKITTNIHGSNVVNSTGGIMIQEVKPRFAVSKPETLAPLHIYNRVGPIFPEGAAFTPLAINLGVFSKCLQEYQI